jgi:hypothetical protein
MGPNSLSTVLRARKINPNTHAFEDTGVLLTPTHVMRALREVAGISAAPELRSVPLQVDGTAFSLA